MKKVRVKIAVAVDHTGNWSAVGWKGLEDNEAFSYAIESLEPGEARNWIEAELSIPEIKTITEVTIKQVEEHYQLSKATKALLIVKI